ncbi:MAG: cbb3-type cytochrome c oxidase subunit I [Candidatus Nitrosopolaris sp.]
MVLEVKKPRAMWEILFSTHHTDIGLLYIITSISFLFMGGVLALSIRSELFLPAAHFLGMGANDFERIFTVHGTDMLLLWVIPFGAGVGNYLIPIYGRGESYHHYLPSSSCYLIHEIVLINFLIIRVLTYSPR